MNGGKNSTAFKRGVKSVTSQNGFFDQFHQTNKISTAVNIIIIMRFGLVGAVIVQSFVKYDRLSGAGHWLSMNMKRLFRWINKSDRFQPGIDLYLTNEVIVFLYTDVTCQSGDGFSLSHMFAIYEYWFLVKLIIKSILFSSYLIGATVVKSDDKSEFTHSWGIRSGLCRHRKGKLSCFRPHHFLLQFFLSDMFIVFQIQTPINHAIRCMTWLWTAQKTVIQPNAFPSHAHDNASECSR